MKEWHLVKNQFTMKAVNQLVTVTSTNYGYFVDKHILYGYLPSSHSKEGTKLEIDYFGKRYPVKVTSEPLLDPEMKRLKC